MKIIILLFASIFLFAIKPLVSYSQNEKATSAFKIVGETKATTIKGEKVVEYDPESPNHLYITDFGKNKIISSKRRFLFKGKKFDLEKSFTYMKEKKLVADGTQTYYLHDGSIGNEDILNEGILNRRTTFYPDGKKKQMSSGDENTLNGEYQIWYQTGQLSFSGNYKNNLKEGEFQQFDPSGTLIKKGVYLGGILVSGDAVVQDVVYDNPEKPAQYINGSEDFEGFLKRRSTEIEGLKELQKEKKIKLNLAVNKSGAITKMETPSALSQPELDFLNAVFKKRPAFTPATVEDIPVESIVTLHLIISNEGIKTDTDLKHLNLSDIFTSAEKMPQFPGDEDALRRFISNNLKYPPEAQKSGIEGKVFVSFVVDENGEVTNVKLARRSNSYLDWEAMRVVRMMPRWKPGYIKGKPVKVSFTMPINFALQ